MTLKELLIKFRLASIRSQLILGIAVLNIVLMSMFVIGMINRQKTFFLELNHDRAMGLSINLASAANSYVISYELSRLQKLVSTYKSMPGLEYAFITSDDGKVIAHTDEKYLGLKATDSVSSKLKPINTTQVLVEDNTILDVASPIINHNEIVGWSRIGISQKYIEPNIAEIKQSGLLYILISLIVSSLFALLVASGLSRGLQKLVVASQKIREGERDLRVGPSTSTEVTKLGTAINKMLDDISTNERLLNMVLENMPVGVFILDAQGKVLSVNPAAKEIWEGAKFVKKEEYNVYRGWFPNGKEIESHEWGAAVALKENRAVINQEAEIEGFDGTRKTILNSCIPMHDANAEITGVISINVDITDRKKAENELVKRNHDIGERVKELNCLYRMSQLSNDPNKSMFDILKDCVDVIPTSYQFPEITCARIIFDDYKFESADFKETMWKQEQHIIRSGVVVGKIQVYYKELRPNEAEGPFLAEERLLINSIADIVSSSADRKKSTDLLKHQMDNSPDIILLINKDFTIESINRGRPDGPAPQELIGKNSLEVLPEESRAISKEVIQRCFETGMNQEMETMLIGNRWVRSRFAPIKIDNVITHIMIIATDITERKKAEEQLVQSEEKNRALIENISDTIVLVNEKLEVIYQSPSFVRAAGLTLDDHKDKTVLQVMHPEELDKCMDIINESKSSPGNAIPFQLRTLHKNGHYIWVEGTVTNLFHKESVKAFVLNYRDITERKHAEEELMALNKKLRQLSAHLENAQEEERTRIAREIHDELGQQLTGLKMDAFWVAKNINADIDKAQNKLNEMVKLIDFTIKTVRRISSDLRPGILDDLGLLPAIEWQGLEFEKRSGVKLNFPPDAPDFNPERTIATNIFRVYQEILTNITRHANATLVETIVLVEENNFILIVKDNGKGFNFEEVKNKGSLGLVGMKERVLLFNGKLSIDSKKNKGTIITLKVPIVNN